MLYLIIIIFQIFNLKKNCNTLTDVICLLVCVVRPMKILAEQEKKSDCASRKKILIVQLGHVGKYLDDKKKKE